MNFFFFYHNKHYLFVQTICQQTQFKFLQGKITILYICIKLIEYCLKTENINPDYFDRSSFALISSILHNSTKKFSC